MLDLQALQATDPKALSPGELAEVFTKMVTHIGQQHQRIDSQEQAIKLRDAKLERVSFELARLKAWKFAARTERMNAQQRQLFEETLAADEASLQAQLEALQQSAAAPTAKIPRIQPKRQVLPEHLKRVVHTHEPENTICGCGAPHRRRRERAAGRGAGAILRAPPHPRQMGLQVLRAPRAGTRGSPNHRQRHAHGGAGGPHDGRPLRGPSAVLPAGTDQCSLGRSHAAFSTLAAWSGRGGAALLPLYEVHRAFVLGAGVLHADETPVNMLDPGAGKTKKAYVWAYARGAFDATPAVAYDFCLGRGAKYPAEFLKGWSGTLVRDEFKGYESVLKLESRTAAGCLAHARRKFDELLKTGNSPVAAQAVQRIAWIYRIEREVQSLTADERLAMRQARAKPLWDALHAWLQVERARVPDGSGIARAIDYSLNHWTALTANLEDGRVPVDNNHIENLMRPWAMGRKAWLFAGSELAGQRAAIVMSLVQSAKLNGHDPWAYLKDVLERLPTHQNSRIDELLPHRWNPSPQASSH
jgi:transposase